MAAEFEDAYGHENIDIDVTVRTHDVKGKTRKPYLSIVCTKVQTADDFVDAFTDDRREIETFFAAVAQG